MISITEKNHCSSCQIRLIFVPSKTTRASFDSIFVSLLEDAVPELPRCLSCLKGLRERGESETFSLISKFITYYISISRRSTYPRTATQSCSDHALIEDTAFTYLRDLRGYGRGFACACACEDKLGGLSLIHISEPTRLGMISYAVFCLKKK